jgi:hypothetical protein
MPAENSVGLSSVYFVEKVEKDNCSDSRCPKTEYYLANIKRILPYLEYADSEVDFVQKAMYNNLPN